MLNEANSLGANRVHYRQNIKGTNVEVAPEPRLTPPPPPSQLVLLLYASKKFEARKTCRFMPMRVLLNSKIKYNTPWIIGLGEKLKTLLLSAPPQHILPSKAYA